jgi:putative tricarboxylic transport membrane protein
VAGQAAADEAAARTSFIPLMAIGIPENAVMALMMAAFVVKGIQPGPNMIATHPDLFWGLVASMWIGNCFLLVLNVPLVRYWLSVFKIPYTVLFPAILFFCCIGTYSINNSLDDIYTTAVFGLVGYLFLRLDMEAAPLLLGFILGPMLEENFRRAMLLSRGSFNVFVNRPISGTLLAMIGTLVVWQIVVFVRKLSSRPTMWCMRAVKHR